ncbi:WUSCHEL-related homeobox 11-like [Impatiens glandulifera]|uniref:WUSCHEL-related homeobox 11-like n=1 Tax=Impatiens glandulifera TaxID=253017 RepID=UPI001FB056DE|nr:WUSCHEL-related homeobox 11-like [Impatiens glandulifera]
MDGTKNNQDPGNRSSERSVEPVRSRWTPKQEQIMILESIFNSGMVNPPKEETIRIRKLLEKFGAVGDANVFYWFQNRRSRSRRRQRQIQTEQQKKLEKTHYSNYQTANPGPAILYETSPTVLTGGPFSAGSSSINNCGFGVGFEDNIYGYSGQNQMFNFPETEHNSNNIPISYAMDISNSLFHHHSGLITVFINGIQTDVPNGIIDMKTMFGENGILVHSSGITVPFNEYGFLLQSLQHGESYFLVNSSSFFSFEM